MTHRLFSPGGLMEEPTHLGVPVRTVDALPIRFLADVVVDYWLPGVARAVRVVIRPEIAWPAMKSERVH